MSVLHFMGLFLYGLFVLKQEAQL